jgi:xylulokinase
MSTFVGLDVGTGGVRAVAVDEAGRIATESSAEYPFSSPRPGWTEQDPEDWLRGSREVLGKVAAEIKDEIVGIGLTGHEGQSLHRARPGDSRSDLLGTWFGTEAAFA